MKFIFKILIGIVIFIICILGIFLIGIGYYNYEESKFYNIIIPKRLNFEKPIKSFNENQIDSLQKLNVNSEKLIVSGNGFFGYDFYMWHKPTEKGEIFIKAFELTQSIELSEKRLRTKTNNKITGLSNKFKLYRGNTIIEEGTFDNFYPVRFELWFKSEKTGKEKKLNEKNYVIDGWDR
ncbi:hypothetical protein [uncultured Tenacibaculum sp.]|uniref:hypothetical protein n=1 Tax=uncultured Tenacibaculum sp. TaxID=174713 RepID=UPI002629F297|nr:hypothetical protein [uncultured Tenacibaculum sp.]